MSRLLIRRACTGSVVCTGRCDGPIGGWRHVQVGRRHAAVDELDPGQRAVLVHLLDQPLVHRDVGVVPEPALDVPGDVGRVVELDLLGAHDRPAALGLDAAHLGVGARVQVAHAVAVRHLEEAVAGRHRPDRHRLEQDVVARVARARPGFGVTADGGGHYLATPRG